MDASALSLCEENGLPIFVFNIEAVNAIVSAALDRPNLHVAGTRVDAGETLLA
jgi:uridylate kinase